MQNRTEKSVINKYFEAQASRELPLIPLKDTVVFPKVAVPIFVRRGQSAEALAEVFQKEQVVVLAAQKRPEIDNPKANDYFKVGTLAKIREMVKEDDGSIRVLVEGLVRVKIEQIIEQEKYPLAKIVPWPTPVAPKDERIDARTYSIINQFRRLVNMGLNVPFDVLVVILNMNEPWMLCDLIASNVDMGLNERQAILASNTVMEKLSLVGSALDRQFKIMQMASKIQAETGKELDKMQREMFLREQIKSIERELESINGKPDDDGLFDRLKNAGMPVSVSEKAFREYKRLQAMPTYNPEQSFIRTYLENLCDLPWDKKDESEINLKKAKDILDNGHYGLEKVKERILEYLAVQKLAGKMRGSIMCFVGPPGTGKTSIGRSIAESMGRKFHRVSLGGLHDEAEIRGHRRTYIGSMPGRIIQGISTVGTNNPVFMLDEIDKIGSDYRGDPSAALLEALDPEQNSEFSDHYLEVPFDLSDVLFIATANVLETIPPALRDRMEVIEFSGYTENEKVEIAKKHLLPKNIKLHGLKKNQCKLNDASLREMIRYYTSEAGVRSLERVIRKVCRKIARKVVAGSRVQSSFSAESTRKLLGPRQCSHESIGLHDTIGVVNGMAWTEAGGELMQIEAIAMPGKGELILTGQLGEVMQESAKTALSFVRSQSKRYKIAEDFFKDTDIHIHVPAGAIPKDGPSAGVAMVVALTSLITGKKIDRKTAMTGEVTLSGRVLEIGGLKEKCMAAHRAGITKVLVPIENKKDLEDIPKEVRDSLKFVFVESADKAIRLVLK